MLKENRERRRNEFWDGADLVMEVVSPDAGSRARDLEKKKLEYAATGISEYWIVDPDEQHIRVLKLKNGSYAEGKPCSRGTVATSSLLPGFEVDVSEVLDSVNE